MRKKILYCMLVLSSSLYASCYETTIISPSPFMGNHGEVFKLLDGSIGEVQYDYEYLYEYLPNVVICPSSNKLIVEGKTININMLSSTSSATNSIGFYIESQIDGNFEGWNGETIFKLTNGQIWQQDSYAYTYSYKYRPNVIIYKEGNRYKMQINGVNGSIYVKKLI